MGYKVLVADDEYIIRRGIISFLKQYEDFEVEAEAEDGEMALEMARTHPLDVCFVDINMPFLNGLQFIEQLKEVNPEAVVVVITGYDKFEYARKALKLGVFEYLLKPLMETPFDEMMKRVRAKIQKDRDKDKYLELAQNILAQNRSYLVSSFLQKMLEGHYSSEEVQERVRFLDLSLPEFFLVTVVSLDYQKTADVKGSWNEDLLFFAAENIANEIFNDLDRPYSCQDRHGNLVILSEMTESAVAAERIHKYCDMINTDFPVKCLAVQKIGASYGTLPEVYEDALDQLKELAAGSAAMKDIRRFLEVNFSKEDLSFQDVADYIHLSVPHLSKMFRKELGVTFVDYLTGIRIRKAIELLRDETLKIYEIAERVGYANQHYFSNVFKKQLGVSPAEYRKTITHNQ